MAVLNGNRFAGGDFSITGPIRKAITGALGGAHRLGLNRINRIRHARKPERRLEIGPGTRPIDGFEAINVVWTWGVDYVGNATGRLPFANNTFNTIYASHVLEHVPWYQVTDVLCEWCRVIRPGGTIEIWVPDGFKIAKAFVDAERNQPNGIEQDGWYRFNPDKDPAVWANGRVFSYGDGKGSPDHYNWHRSLFSERSLKRHLETAGFSSCRRMDRSEVRGYDHGWINLGVEGRKV